jgi:KDO2-lipid IV(A) lauroyltransferase
MNLRKKIQRIGENFLSRLALIVIPNFPRSAILLMSQILGSLGVILPIRERRIVLANLRLAYGNSISEAKKKKIMRDSFRTIVLMTLDCFWFTKNAEKRLHAYVKFDSSCEIFYKTKPAVVVTGHFGNWEIMAIAAAFLGYPTVVVAKPLPNANIERILTKFREIAGQRVVLKEGAIRALLGALKNGKRVAFLLDQNTQPKEGGEFVKFFGRYVPVSRAVAKLSIHTGAPVIFIFCIPLDDGYYRVYTSCSIDPEKWNDNRKKFTQVITNEIEKQVRSNPKYWNWVYKRWKYIPPGEPCEMYPFYAKYYIDPRISTKNK